MTARPKGVVARAVDAAEEWIYALNERDHWIFELYDQANEFYAAVFMQGVRRAAAGVDDAVTCADGTPARIRFLTTADDQDFAALLAGLHAKYLPPHARDARGAARALRRRSYLPFGITVEGRLVGYLLLRMFFPWRVVTGIWTLPATHNLKLAQTCLRRTRAFSRTRNLADYCTVPIDNPNSVRTALGAGFEMIRTNARFHVFRHP